ncbi:hypothetical protein SUDANB105_07995 [Streptomyces sp. enrichment culture]|uniref:hypothetical protein n=1 Tax=Streptomyces sp. enrichment culture TaxID=1795815 RepID=UPI003F5494A3
MTDTAPWWVPIAAAWGVFTAGVLAFIAALIKLHTDRRQWKKEIDTRVEQWQADLDTRVRHWQSDALARDRQWQMDSLVRGMGYLTGGTQNRSVGIGLITSLITTGNLPDGVRPAIDSVMWNQLVYATQHGQIYKAHERDNAQRLLTLVEQSSYKNNPAFDDISRCIRSQGARTQSRFTAAQRRLREAAAPLADDIAVVPFVAALSTLVQAQADRLKKDGGHITPDKWVETLERYFPS